MKRPTIADVARLARVNKATVSHALSGKRPVSAEARARVEQAVRELAYRPNPAAQRLAGGHSYTIGLAYPLYVPHVAGLEMQVIAAASRVVNLAGYAFVPLLHPEERPDGLERLLQGGLLDGVILMQPRLQDSRIDLLRAAQLPFVLIGRTGDNTGLCYVDFDIDVALRACVDHLYALGHRNFVYLRMDKPDLGFSARACTAYHTACEHYGLAVRSLACGLSYDSGRAAMAEALSRYPNTTAAIVYNDLAAWGAAQAAEEAGLRIPADLSLISFEDANLPPGVPFRPTAVNLCLDEIAGRAASLLIDMLDCRPVEQAQSLFDPFLMIHNSTGPARPLKEAPMG